MANTNLTTALWITLIGIILVFVGILLLWGMMELLVYLTRKRKKENEPQDSTFSANDERTLKQKAAAAAVATAIRLQNSTTIPTPLCQQEALTPWQSVQRSHRSLPYSKHTK
ncbi:MAG TPA: OadG family protein [Anaerolineaceae bacterium]|jgi:Na+-transporting methylmalonyl-CoA/oxaloacetate decarboxylase gamma subunit|nr:OadG family protein [Anaerolineaceae bacterium]